MTKRVKRGTAKAFFRMDQHALYRRAPYGTQLVISKSLRKLIMSLELHTTVAAHPAMN